MGRIGEEVRVARFSSCVRLIRVTLLFLFGSSIFLANLYVQREAFAQELANCFPGSKKPASEVVTLINNWRVSQRAYLRWLPIRAWKRRLSYIPRICQHTIFVAIVVPTVHNLMLVLVPRDMSAVQEGR